MPKIDSPAVPVAEPILTLLASKNGRKPKIEEREVTYKNFEVRLCWKGKDATHPPLDWDTVKMMLGLETETEYAIRMMAEDTKLQKADCKFPGHVQVMRNPDGERFVCWNNSRNRHFNEQDATKIAYEFLEQHWAGPTNLEGETVNGSPVRITRQSWVFDGQYRLIAYDFACRIMEKESKYKARFPKGIPFETVLILGISDDQRVFDTVDIGVPRTFADNIHTSKMFRDLYENHRWECSKMFMSATNYLWKRTGADAMGTSASYRSYATLDDFAKNHKTIEKCVRWLFDCNNVGENATRFISELGLPAGICAAALYLMASGDSAGNDYRTGDKQGVRKEKPLSWKYMDRAKDFFAELTKPEQGELSALRTALDNLEDPSTGRSGSLTEKLCILSLAWKEYMNGSTLKIESLSLKDYLKPDSNGKISLVNPPIFGNLDLGPSPEIEEENLEEKKRKIREEEARKASALLEQGKNERSDPTNSTNGETTPVVPITSGKKKGKDKSEDRGKPDAEQLEDVRKEYPGTLILFQGSATVYVYNGDVDTVIKAHGQKPIRDISNAGLRTASWPLDHTAEIVASLKSVGLKVAVASKDKKGGTRVETR